MNTDLSGSKSIAILEQALQQSEARYLLLTDSIPHIVWSCLPDGSCDYFNAYIAEYTGIPVEKCLEWGWKALIHPDDLPDAEARWMHSVRTGDPYEAEFRLRTASGVYHWNLDRGHAMKNDSGEIIAWIGTSTDIEIQKRADEYSRRFAAIVASSQDAIVSKDLDGIITSWNAAAERIYGYSAEEIIGKPKSLVIPPGRAYELDTILNKVRAGERIEPFDTVRLRKDGSLIEISVTVSPIRDAKGKVIGASTIARDISERTRAEILRAQLTEEIARHRQRLDDLISSVPGVVWEAWGQPDARTQHIDFVSDHVVKMLGYTTEEWVSTPNFWLTIVHPEDREQAARVAMEAWTSGSQHINQFRWIRKDGRVIWCESHSVVIRNRAGEPIGMRGVAIDVSDRKQTEEERSQHLVEIELLNMQLQRAMAETHHRVRNNLQIIAALVEMETLDTGATIGITKFHRIAGHVRALAAVHDLLTQQAKKDSLVTNMSAQEMLLKLVGLVRQTIGAHRIIAEIEEARLSTRQATSLAVVAHELITNAVKYAQGTIEVRFVVRDQTATLEVADDGPGFHESFDPEASGNTGLELITHVARWDLHAEELRFDTRSQGGARVRITMPLSGADIAT